MRRGEGRGGRWRGSLHPAVYNDQASLCSEWPWSAVLALMCVEADTVTTL